MEVETLKFSPLQSFVDTSFWHILSKKKLNDFKLNEGPHKIYGYYEHIHNVGNSNKILLDMDSFERKKHSERRTLYYLKGNLWTLNTIESFRNIDKMQFINSVGNKKYEEMLKNNAYLKRPDKLCKFFVLSYSDLKHYNFYFWFAFPAPIFTHNPIQGSGIHYLDEYCTKAQIDLFLNLFDDLQKDSKSMFFTVFIKDGSIRVDKFCFFDINDEDCLLGFCDTSINPNYPGWPLRNILFAICVTLIPQNEKRTIRLLSFRNNYSNSIRDASSSSIMEVQLTGFDLKDDLKYTGWEKWKNELKPRRVNLSSSMNPRKLAESAVDLNLKLMKWRLIPDLDLHAVTSVKCLLLGAGTLGCNVARQLLAWNVGQITLVDNGKVSYSNPVRQSLFTFEQSSVSGGVNKAAAAAESLQKIYPEVKVTSHDLSVPMPGHHVSPNELEQVKATVIQLEELIKCHDVVFLLMDTREARWLPSLLACFYRKMVLNIALGFDTYLVMRHGLSPSEGVSPCSLNSLSAGGDSRGTNNRLSGNELGCYFCADVVGPANSTRDRTLDQQCTVTRPGISMIAAACGVELMVTLLQHKDGAAAPVEKVDNAYEFESCLGCAPHQIRGYISTFNNILPYHKASTYCTACSQKVLDAYQNEGFDFLYKSFNDHTYLEQVTGLKDLQTSIDIDCVTALSDSDNSV